KPPRDVAGRGGSTGCYGTTLVTAAAASTAAASTATVDHDHHDHEEGDEGECARDPEGASRNRHRTPLSWYRIYEPARGPVCPNRRRGQLLRRGERSRFDGTAAQVQLRPSSQAVAVLAVAAHA